MLHPKRLYHVPGLEDFGGSGKDSNNCTDDDFEECAESEPDSEDGGLSVIPRTLANRKPVQWGPEELVLVWALVEVRFHHYSTVGCDY